MKEQKEMGMKIIDDKIEDHKKGGFKKNLHLIR